MPKCFLGGKKKNLQVFFSFFILNFGHENTSPKIQSNFFHPNITCVDYNRALQEYITPFLLESAITRAKSASKTHHNNFNHNSHTKLHRKHTHNNTTKYTSNPKAKNYKRINFFKKKE